VKIAIFGASGTTGRLLTEKCLAAGHSVSALVRTPAKFPYADKVRVVQGDVFSLPAIAETLRNADAVLSALGAKGLGEDHTLERGIPLIVQAMIDADISRIIVLGSAGALDTAMDKQFRWQKWVVEKIVYKTLLKWPVIAQRYQYAALAASPLDWTMPMPPMLTNLKGRGKLRVDPDALPPFSAMISREDVADFMFAQLTSNQWSRKAVYISW
jgi:putative NADH-flavin reductase